MEQRQFFKRQMHDKTIFCSLPSVCDQCNQNVPAGDVALLTIDQLSNKKIVLDFSCSDCARARKFQPLGRIQQKHIVRIYHTVPTDSKIAVLKGIELTAGKTPQSVFEAATSGTDAVTEDKTILAGREHLLTAEELQQKRLAFEQRLQELDYAAPEHIKQLIGKTEPPESDADAD